MRLPGMYEHLILVGYREAEKYTKESANAILYEPPDWLSFLFAV